MIRRSYSEKGPAVKKEPECERNGESKSESNDHGECDVMVLVAWLCPYGLRFRTSL